MFPILYIYSPAIPDHLYQENRTRAHPTAELLGVHLPPAGRKHVPCGRIQVKWELGLMVVVTPTKIYCKKIEKSCITVTVLVGIDDLFGDCYSHSGLYVCIFGLCLAPQKILFPMIKSMDVRNTWKYPMFKQTHIMQGRLYVPLYPIIYLCIPSMIGLIPPCLSHGITHLSDKAISWKGLQQNPIKSHVFSMKYPPPNSCLHMLTLWNPSVDALEHHFPHEKQLWLEDIPHYESPRWRQVACWNCHMTRGNHHPFTSQKKMGTKVLTMWGSPVTSWFKNIPMNYRNYWFIWIIISYIQL